MESVLLGRHGDRRLPATMPGYRGGRPQSHHQSWAVWPPGHDLVGANTSAQQLGWRGEESGRSTTAGAKPPARSPSSVGIACGWFTLLPVEGGRTGVTLRPAHDGDASAVAQIWHEGWRDAHEGHVPAELLAARTADSFELRAAERISDTVVAIVEHTVAGFVMVVEDEVEQVYVAREHRGSAVAATLLAEAERVVSRNGHKQAWLAVVASNARARRFYERRGWRDDGLIEYRAATATGPVLVTAHRYAKHLTDYREPARAGGQ